MSTGNFTDSSDFLEVLLTRVRSHLGVERDADVRKALGVSSGAIPTWRKRETIPYDVFVKWAMSSDVSLDWLFYGGPHEMAGEIVEAGGGVSDEFFLVPLYDIAASTGHGASLDEERITAQLAFRDDWIRAQGWPRESLAALTAKGDSMEPTIQDGALLLVNLEQSAIAEDGIYILRFDSQLYAKRLQRMIDGAIYIKSDNSAYDDQVINKDETEQLAIIGRVVWMGSKV